jgi:hypothetical protein
VSWGWFANPPNCSVSATTIPETQGAEQASNGCTFPTLMAAIAIDVMNRLIVERQET